MGFLAIGIPPAPKNNTHPGRDMVKYRYLGIQGGLSSGGLFRSCSRRCGGCGTQKKVRRRGREIDPLSKEELAEGWEFKIVRSNTAIKGERFARLCAEEAENGWELVEKFDNNRIRFKRPIAKRENDHMAIIDPYRTRIGMSEGALAAVVVGVILFIFFFVVLLIESLN